MWARVILAVLVIAVPCATFKVGYSAGELHQQALHAAEAAEIAKQAEDASRRTTEALRHYTNAIAEADALLAETERMIADENAPADTCAVDARRVLQLDSIR